MAESALEREAAELGIFSDHSDYEVQMVEDMIVQKVTNKQLVDF